MTSIKIDSPVSPTGVFYLCMSSCTLLALHSGIGVFSLANLTLLLAFVRVALYPFLCFLAFAFLAEVSATWACSRLGEPFPGERPHEPSVARHLAIAAGACMRSPIGGTG